MKILITGGAGFIGSAVIRHVIRDTSDSVVNVDKLTYAGNLESLAEVSDSDRYAFEQVDICNRAELDRVLRMHQPDCVMHLAAESHVDRSIDGPGAFVQTNVLGTCTLLEAARAYWQALAPARQAAFRFHHISTDEVYGDLSPTDPAFVETTAYHPSSPYSASKAASDHLVRAWHRTYGLPVLITNCSNNYGPYQFPEKLIPLVILNALEGKPLPVYGRGENVRDWLYVDDHARALYTVLTRGAPGETYNIGGHSERTNLQVVQTICALLDELAPRSQQPALPDQPSLRGAQRRGNPDKGSAALQTQPHAPSPTYQSLITHVTDRPGHDRRYAIDARKIKHDLGWVPQETFESGLRKTVAWYLAHRDWCRRVQDGSYQREQLGLVTISEAIADPHSDTKLPQPTHAPYTRDGLPLLAVRTDGAPVTPELVAQLQEELPELPTCST